MFGKGATHKLKPSPSDHQSAFRLSNSDVGPQPASSVLNSSVKNANANNKEVQFKTVS